MNASEEIIIIDKNNIREIKSPQGFVDLLCKSLTVDKIEKIVGSASRQPIDWFHNSARIMYPKIIFYFRKFSFTMPNAL